MGDENDLILALRSQIFEYLRETFCRRALGYLQSVLSEKKRENMLFIKTVVGGGTFSLLAPVLRPVNKKSGHVTLPQFIAVSTCMIPNM